MKKSGELAGRAGPFRLGVDVGGTFTDVLLLDEQTGALQRAKTLSTFPNPAQGVIRGIEKLLQSSDIDASAIRHLMHGTTAATNAVLERRGARVVLVVTEGFRQVLHLARGHIPGGLGGWAVWQQPPPLASLEDTIEVLERMGPDGQPVRAVDHAALQRDMARLLSDPNVETIAVALFNSHLGDEHERSIEEELRNLGWKKSISLSSEIAPEQGEYERAITTVMNAYVSPAVSDYCAELVADVAQIAPEAKIHILRSDGGLMSVDAAIQQPVNMLLSGPAGGVAGAIAVARAAGYEDFLTLDMGGTSTDVALVERGRPEMGRETTVGDFTVRSAAIAVHTIGAGGGSIAHVPALTNALRVGPQSAGSNPGPAAYGRGGVEPTVTDANLVLGYLPGHELADEVTLDREAAECAIGVIAGALSLELRQAAAGIHDVVNENMLGALRVVSVQQGRDPRNFALLALGGAGPLHANALACLLGTWPVIVPPAPGVLCAFGEATTQIRNEMSRSVVRPLIDVSATELRTTLDELTRQAVVALQVDGVGPDHWTRRCEADLRYAGQSQVLTIPVTEDVLRQPDSTKEMRHLFDQDHMRLFTFALDTSIELVSIRAIVESSIEEFTPPEIVTGDGSPSRAATGEQQVWISGHQQTASVYQRGRLAAGDCINGPAVVLEMDSTTLVLPGHTAVVDRFGNLIIRPAHEAGSAETTRTDTESPDEKLR